MLSIHNMKYDTFDQLPLNIKETICKICENEVYYIETASNYSWEHLEKRMKILITGNVRHSEKLLDMFKVAAETMNEFELHKQHSQKCIKQKNGQSIIVPWMHRFRKKYWFQYDPINVNHYDTCQDRMYSHVYYEWKNENTNFEGMVQEFINTLNAFDIWFHEKNYDGSSKHLLLLSAINRIYEYIISKSTKYFEKYYEEPESITL